MTTFVSLYQAGEGIYEQFDKVLVIDKGRQVFFGPADQARQYFINLGYKDLPRQTTADYLTGCTDENERRENILVSFSPRERLLMTKHSLPTEFADGRDKSNVPSTSESLEEAFRASPYYFALEAERRMLNESFARDLKGREEFLLAVQEDKRKGVPKKSPYTTGLWTQIAALTVRQTQIRLQDRVGMTVNLVTIVSMAIIIGTVGV